MTNRTRQLTAATGVLAVALTLGLAGCSSSTDDGSGSTPAADSADVAAADSADAGAGFEEFPVGDDQEVFPISVAGVYFQPIDMEPSGMGLAASQSSFHLEADIAAMADNELGYGVGDFVPGLTVDYSIAEQGSGDVVSSGTFMTMNASDGPHYGANIALDEAGEYVVTFSIHSPEESGWMLHVDPETGVEGRYWTTPIEVSWDWNYTPQEW